MARMKETEIEGVQISETPIVESANIKEPVAEVVVTNEVKKVKIQAVEEINCIIAGKPYRLQKDKQHSVPTDVAAILCYSKKAYKI